MVKSRSHFQIDPFQTFVHGGGSREAALRFLVDTKCQGSRMNLVRVGRAHGG